MGKESGCEFWAVPKYPGVGGSVDRYLARVCVLYLCAYAQPSLSDGPGLFVADRCSLLTRPESDERRGYSLKFRYLPFNASVDPLCCGSSRTMSHQLTGLMGKDSQGQSENVVCGYLAFLAGSRCETGEFNKVCLTVRHGIPYLTSQSDNLMPTFCNFSC